MPKSEVTDFSMTSDNNPELQLYVAWESSNKKQMIDWDAIDSGFGYMLTFLLFSIACVCVCRFGITCHQKTKNKKTKQIK